MGSSWKGGNGFGSSVGQAHFFPSSYKEGGAAQQDKLQLQVMAASLQQAVEMREKEQAARARQQAGATSTTRPVTADGQRRRRRRPV